MKRVLLNLLLLIVVAAAVVFGVPQIRNQVLLRHPSPLSFYEVGYKFAASYDSPAGVTQLNHLPRIQVQTQAVFLCTRNVRVQHAPDIQSEWIRGCVAAFRAGPDIYPANATP